MSHSPLARIAGPAALVAGVLMAGAQLAMLPFDPRDHIATSTNIVFQLGGVAYLLGFVVLLVALVASYSTQAARSGRLGLVAMIGALAGTMVLGGDLWFETFAVPWLADQSPEALYTDPTILIGIGAIGSYLLFAAGWALYGIASLRARVFPSAISIAIVIGGIAGYNALLSPYGIPLGLAMAGLGVWTIRAQAAEVSTVSPIVGPLAETSRSR